MFAGHFGVAAAVKGTSNKLPVWSLLVSSQLLDIVFFPLSLLGLEYIGEPIEGGAGNFIHAEYSHSIAGAILLSFFTSILAARFWGRKNGAIIGLITISHWILDLIVHMPDLPILPGNAGNLPYLGFGLWQYPTASILLEGTLIAIGIILYFRHSIVKSNGGLRSSGVLKGSLMALFLAFSFIFSI